MPFSGLYFDVTPLVTGDDSQLFFSSMPSLAGEDESGDFDLWTLALNLAGEWGEPTNVGAPINTEAAASGLLITACILPVLILPNTKQILDQKAQ